MGKKKHHENKVYPNDPCKCGSGKKWKKCCKVKDQIHIAMEDVARRFRSRPSQIFEKSGAITGRPFIDEIFEGYRFRAVGGKLYKRDKNETFHEFLWFLFVQKLSLQWFDQESLKAKDEQHPIMQWVLEGREMVEKGMQKDEKFNAYGIPTTGNMKELLALQYDLYSLDHCQGDILQKLLNRLKIKDQFQGARYEIAVAGIAVRSGFEIEWINDTGKHCEFIGTHKITKDKVGFETKSHHREGVLGRPGVNFDPNNARIKIMSHISEALEQGDPHIPLIIFDDLNLPLSSKTTTKETKWFSEVNDSLTKFGFFNEKTKEERKNYGALFVTNFSWHFHEKPPTKENEVLAYWHVNGKYSIKPETLGCIDEATKQYGFVPHKLDERVIDK